MLLKGQGLTIEHPQRTLGTVVGAVPALVALALAIALIVATSDWPISWPRFLAYLAAIGLVAVAVIFGFWAYACATLRYVVNRGGLVIRWGPLRHLIPLSRIEKLLPGRGEHRPRLRGLSWWGHHVGKGRVEGIGEVLFFSTHRSPEELVYVQTPSAIYAISPQDPIRFAAFVQRFQQATASAPASSESEAVERQWLAGHPLWSDRIGQGLAIVAVLLNVGLFGYLFAVYPDLSNQISIEFPPLGEITNLDSKRELLKLPATALALLAVNLLAAFGLQWKERAATYLLLTGSIFLQALFGIATGIAIINA